MSSPLRPAPALAAAACSAGLFVLAYPGMDFWPLAFVALTPLYLAIDGQSWRARLACGWCTGTLMVALGFCWLPGAFQRITGAGALTTGALQLAFCLWHGLELVLLVLLAAGFSAAGLPRTLGWALAHVGAELAFPRVLPYTFAASLHALPWALQSVAWLGPASVVFLLAGSQAAFGELILQHRSGSVAPGARKALAVWGALWCGQLAWGAVELSRTNRAIVAGQQQRVSVIQANTAPLLKRDAPDTSLEDHLRLSRELLRRERPDVLVWSETSLPTPLPAEWLSGAVIRRLHGGLGVPIVLGAVVRESGPPEAQFNSVLSVAADGFVCSDCRYDKRSLVPLIEDAARGGARRFDPGTRQRPLQVAGHPVAPLVCFEATSPQPLRALMAEHDAQWLVHLANDGWFGDSREPAIHLALAQLRAIEHRRFLVRAATTGISAIVAPTGEITAQALRGEATLTESITLLSGTTPYQRFGDSPWWAALAASLAWAGARRIRRDRSASERRL